MPTTTYTQPNPAAWTAIDWPFAISWARAKYLALAGAVVLGLAFRLSVLAAYGLSEDEINKLHAVEQYRAGRFTANAEHPMLMKAAMWGSVAASDAWNARVPAGLQVPLETALRAPNAVAGAATTAALFGVADLLFGGPAAVVAAAIWAFDVNAIAINRIGKEDTLLLLFFLVAIFCYERAKRAGARDLASARRWYTLSGAAFGLMLASKYMPHYLGVYAVFNLITDPEPGENRPSPLRYYGAMAIAFVLADPVILSPATWRYAVHYVGGDLLAHHGYLYAGALYVTNVPVSPLGVPPTYYLRLLATRVPLVVLAAAVPGVIEMIRRRRERGFVLLRTLAIFLLVPYSLMAAKFLRYSLPMIATVDLVAAVGLVAGVGWLLRKGWLTLATRRTVAAMAIVVFAVGLASAQQTAAPFYSLFQNGVGARVDPRGSAFPEQTYDYGVREAAALLACGRALRCRCHGCAGCGVSVLAAGRTPGHRRPRPVVARHRRRGRRDVGAGAGRARDVREPPARRAPARDAPAVDGNPHGRSRRAAGLQDSGDETMPRQLVVNADDLGLTVGVNDGIFDAHDLGILTSASLFANAPATGDAIARGRQRPSLGIGAHLALVDGAPTLPPDDVPTLVADDGRFRRSWKPFIVACLQRRVSLDDVERELTAQIARLQRAGVRLTHLDAHKHVHAYPPIFAIVARLAIRFGIPAVRVPYERRTSAVAASPRDPAFAQAWLNAALWPWARANYRVAAALGVRTPAFVGRVRTGFLDRASLAAMLRAIGRGVTELMVHPGYADDDLRRAGTRLVESRHAEVELLCSMETRARLVAERIDLVRHDLSHPVRRSVRYVS